MGHPKTPDVKYNILNNFTRVSSWIWTTISPSVHRRTLWGWSRKYPILSWLILISLHLYFRAGSSTPDTIVHFKKTQNKFFVNNFCVPELQKLKFLTQNNYANICQITISKFSFGKNYVKKNRVYFLAICANLTCKIENFESCRCGYIRDRILLSGQSLTYFIGKSQLKK